MSGLCVVLHGLARSHLSPSKQPSEMKRLYAVIIVVVLLLIAAEIALRLCLGMCDALLYRADEDYEYIAQPSQRHRRFGAHISYNSYSQRSEEPDTARGIVLGLGDSVLFGGTWMDQDSLATTLFTEATGRQMLNISAGSWGPDNCAAYLHKHGTFGAKAMVLVCSSHDAYDVMSHQPVVGVYPNYPERQYISALQEFCCRYLFPYLRGYARVAGRALDPDEQVVAHIDNGTVAKKSARFNPGFDELKQIADSLDIPFAVYLHAETGEIAAGQYNDMGQRIIAWADSCDVTLLTGLETGETIDMYHDIIHVNAKGQRHIAECLKRMCNDLQ